MQNIGSIVRASRKCVVLALLLPCMETAQDKIADVGKLREEPSAVTSGG